MSNSGMAPHKFDVDSLWFVGEVSSRRRVLPSFAHASRVLTDKAEKEFDKLIDTHTKDKTYDEKGALESYIVEEGYARRHAILQRAFADFAIFSVSLPKMALVSVVSLFDAYLARIMRNVYIVKPEILNSCERQMTFTQLVSFGSIENARDHIIEKEIESLLRESHVAQFEWLSKTLKISLTELPSWKDFVELTERRNLLVHADGVVSAHYLDTCRKHGIELDPEVKAGFRLSISQDYYTNACNCVAEIGLKLAQVLWRKLRPNELQLAEDSFIGICYDMLIQGEYRLAEQILNISREKAFKKLNAESEYYLTINLAIAFRGQEKIDECVKLLAGIDFSALCNKFKLANLVLTEKYTEAAALMKKMGINDEFTESHYREFPVFRWFRKTDEFKEAYLHIFGKEFAIIKEASYHESITQDEDLGDSLDEISEEQEDSSIVHLDGCDRTTCQCEVSEGVVPTPSPTSDEPLHEPA